MRFGKGLALFLYLSVMPGLGLEASSGARAGEGVARLVDVTEGSLYDGWGREAVRTLTSYYAGSDGAVEMLGYRASFLPVFDWRKGQIASDVQSDLSSFYASGAGSSRVQSAQDPAYAVRFKSRYQEPAGRMQEEAGAGYALGLAASQSRVATSDYQDWQDAGLGSASGIAGAGLEGSFTTAAGLRGSAPTSRSLRKRCAIRAG